MLDADGSRPDGERVLAVARMFLAALALLAIYLDPTEPARYAGLAYSLLASYLIFALAVAGLLARFRAAPVHAAVVHGLDVLFAGAITFFTQGPNSPFFVLLVFTLMGAAYRWGLRATLGTAAGLLGLLALEATLIEPALGLRVGGGPGDFEPNRFVMRSAYLAIAGGLLGYLGESNRRLGAEAQVAARIMNLARVRSGLWATIHASLGAILQLTGAKRGLIVARERTSGRLLNWQLDAGGAAALRFAELDPAVAAAMYLPDTDWSWHAAFDGASRRRVWAALLPSGFLADRSAIVLDAQGARRPGNVSPPAGILAAHPCRSLLSVPLALGDDWVGRLFLLNCPSAASRVESIRFLQRLSGQVSPALHNVYLLHRLRAHAEATERARLARDLHDGVTQTLLAAVTQVEVLRRGAADDHPLLAVELGRIREMLHGEVLNLRETMRRMGAWRVTSAGLVKHLAETVDRFQRDTGAAARFWSDLGPEDIRLAPRACREVAQILIEALVNVRKHSGATRVLVSMTGFNDHLRLSVEDDGRGFPFSGQRSRDELEADRTGPRVIAERTRVIGADLLVESKPGAGARLVVSWPR